MIKFENQKAFEQHLISSNLKESEFLIIINDEKELRDLADRIQGLVCQKHPGCETKVWDCSKDSIEAIVSSFDARSLFSNIEVAQIHHVEELSRKNLEALSGALSRKGDDLFVILTTSKSVSIDCVVLDLSSEKPWDHKKRVMALLFEYVRKADKTIAYDALEKLIEAVGLDLGQLMQHMELLICYAGGRKDINSDDLKVLGVTRKKHKTWQLADYLTFGEGVAPITEEMADSDFYSLLVQIRSRIALGIKIKEGGRPVELSDSLLTKYSTWCQRLPKRYFIEAFDEIYNVERLSKSSQFSTALLFDTIYVKLKNRRERLIRVQNNW